MRRTARRGARGTIRGCRVRHRHPCREDEHAEPGRPVPELAAVAGEHLRRSDPDGLDAGDDAQRQESELHQARDEAARAGDHLTGGELENRGRQGGAGEEDDQRRDHGPQPRPGEVVLDGERAECGHGDGGDDGHQDLQLPLLPADGPQHPDQRAEDGCGRDVTRGRVKDQAEAQGEHGIAEDALGRPVAGTHVADVGELPEALGRRRPAPSAWCARWSTAAIWSSRGNGPSPDVSSTVAASPRPIVTIM